MRGYMWLQHTHHAATHCHTLQQIYRWDAKGVNARLHVGPGDLRAFFSHLFLDVWAFQNILSRIYPWITVCKCVHHAAVCAFTTLCNICNTLQHAQHSATCATLCNMCNTLQPQHSATCATLCNMCNTLQHAQHSATCATLCNMRNTLQHAQQLPHIKALPQLNWITVRKCVHHTATCATPCNNNMCDTLQQLSHTIAPYAAHYYMLQHVLHAATCATLCNNFHIPKHHVGAAHKKASSHAC